MKLLGYLHRQSPGLLTFATASSVVSGLSGAALIAIIGKGVSASNIPLATLAWLFFALSLLHLVAKTAAEISLVRLTQSAISDMRIALSHQVLATPQKRLQELGKPGLLVLLSKDIDSFTEAFVWLPIGFGNAIIIIACFAYLAWLSIPAFLIMIGFLVIGFLAFSIAEKKPRQLLIDVREKLDALYDHFRNLIEGSRELQLNTARGERYIERVVAVDAIGYRDMFTRGMTGYNMAGNVGSILFFLLIGVVLFLLPQVLPQPTEVIATTTFTLLYLVRPVAELVFSLPVVRQAEIAIGKFEQLEKDLATTDTPAPLHHQPCAAGTEWTLELCGIRHRYPSSSDDRQFVLGPLDLTLKQGEILYIVGGNGSGKTTLAMLILGLYRPDEGEIRLNGQLITETHIDAYRQNFSAVFADFHLFEQLLDADDPQLHARANHYLQALGMAHKVKVVDGRYSTVNLSTGQRKRLALVSAYLEDRPIYLFDEWAADQDPVFKKVFYTELLPELKARGKTVIVITHDDAYFSCADRILKLEDGHSGTPTPTTP